MVYFFNSIVYFFNYYHYYLRGRDRELSNHRLTPQMFTMARSRPDRSQELWIQARSLMGGGGAGTPLHEHHLLPFRVGISLTPDSASEVVYGTQGSNTGCNTSLNAHSFFHILYIFLKPHMRRYLLFSKHSTCHIMCILISACFKERMTRMN